MPAKFHRLMTFNPKRLITCSPVEKMMPGAISCLRLGKLRGGSIKDFILTVAISIPLTEIVPILCFARWKVRGDKGCYGRP